MKVIADLFGWLETMIVVLEIESFLMVIVGIQTVRNKSKSKCQIFLVYPLGKTPKRVLFNQYFFPISLHLSNILSKRINVHITNESLKINIEANSTFF